MISQMATKDSESLEFYFTEGSNQMVYNTKISLKKKKSLSVITEI